ncbi:hypothetical protein Y1Q_0001084 [Alligator mississippiensis]|uniref:Uncharacterized protein n=1 Tax=Alligator mississippiensis TaxID=8496 RepID=A0A151NEN0_ALLMI|nr:hypothetical protein Y1Q_0001084 [Alligator mississippiensis]
MGKLAAGCPHEEKKDGLMREGAALGCPFPELSSVIKRKEVHLFMLGNGRTNSKDEKRTEASHQSAPASLLKGRTVD